MKWEGSQGRLAGGHAPHAVGLDQKRYAMAGCHPELNLCHVPVISWCWHGSQVHQGSPGGWF